MHFKKEQKEIWNIAPRYGIVLEEWNHDDHVHVMLRAQSLKRNSVNLSMHIKGCQQAAEKEYPEIRERATLESILESGFLPFDGRGAPVGSDPSIHRNPGKSIEHSISFRIYPTEEQKIYLGKTFGCCRFLYNQMLNDKIGSIKDEKLLKYTMYKRSIHF